MTKLPHNDPRAGGPCLPVARGASQTDDDSGQSRLRRLARKAAAGLVAMGLVASPMLASPAAGVAATTGGYQTALVEYGASTRTEPYFSYGGQSTYWGYALHQPGSQARQTVSVKCWWNGDWATGNYSTNRWFRVLVWESYDGYGVPRWLFVHASYVYNQPVVPMCQQTGAGIF